MALVSYSGSEESDSDAQIASHRTSKPPSAPRKPAFQKVVNRSAPHKIEVHLPDVSQSSGGSLEVEQGPPAKRLRLGAGTTGDFNSLLPAPKRAPAARRTPSINGYGKEGLGKAASLKTSANPGFRRESPGASATIGEELPVEDVHGIPGSQQKRAADIEVTLLSEDQVNEPQKKPSHAIFRPLSVGKKPKKKRAEPQEEVGIVKPPSRAQAKGIATVKTASLFFAGDVAEAQSESSSNMGDYRPMLYNPVQHSGDEQIKSLNSMTPEENKPEDKALNESSKLHETSQSLDTVAADLNLSASAKRQLFGRNKNKSSEVSIVNFDTDQEYAANELLRQAGEQAQHNPVRSIAPGKHSLKQLVNAASHQKDALEEHFASGKRNKREAGSKYGW
ncbi:MAG: hypothetical protein HETSPECPRED_001591 [Heterodermia speciosa]|uniref:Mitotic checkpoint regulator, MAD2B-interacting-domain-containing protein n=1 Tax=Heterodermia speciosa TaxID=116794 RepID=A0A8H3EY51_9LECA|nr:MAG: hypothetical protein HETSPECPRED_001591 [Heterodermia speciosa]